MNWKGMLFTNIKKFIKMLTKLILIVTNKYLNCTQNYNKSEN